MKNRELLSSLQNHRGSFSQTRRLCWTSVLRTDVCSSEPAAESRGISQKNKFHRQHPAFLLCFFPYSHFPEFRGLLARSAHFFLTPLPIMLYLCSLQNMRVLLQGIVQTLFCCEADPAEASVEAGLLILVQQKQWRVRSSGHLPPQGGSSFQERWKEPRLFFNKLYCT